MGNTSLCTPLPATPILKEPKMDVEEDQQWRNIKNIIAAIAVPSKTTNSPSFSEESTPVDNNDDTAALLLPKVVDTAASESSNAYGTFNPSTSSATPAIVPLHPNSLVTSAALTPVYLILMLLPLLPFWIFAGFLCYVAATSPFAETHITLLALAFLLPFNTIGTVAVIRFALSEREKAVQATAEPDLEIASPLSQRSSWSSRAGEKRLWRPSMQFVLHGARREGRRL